MLPPEQIALYPAALAELDKAGIRSIVQRGYADWPAVSGDLDLLVHPADLDSATKSVVRSFSTQQFGTTVLCTHVDIPVVVNLGPQPGEIAEIDLSPRSFWAGGEFLRVGPVLDRRRRTEGGIWIAAAGDESALLGVPALFGATEVRLTKGWQRLPRIRSLIAEDPDGASRAWSEAVGSRYARTTLEAIVRGDMAAIADVARRARARRVAINLGLAPFATSRRVAYTTITRRLSARCGLWSATWRGLKPLRSVTDPPDWDQLVGRIAAQHGRPQLRYFDEE